MTYRLIALDLDGTTLDSRREIRPATLAALDEARARGVEVILVSGRHHGAIRPYHHQLGLNTPAICCNGAYVYDFARSAPTAGAPLGRAQAGELLTLCRRHEMHMLVYADDLMTYEVPTRHLQGLLDWSARFPVGIRPEFRRVDRFEDVIDGATAIWKFLISHDDRERIDRCCAEMDAIGDLSRERSWFDRVDVVHAGNTKGTRLAEWVRNHGIDLSAVIAFGDNQNDIDMLSAVGLGVAMAEAEPSVRAAADMVAGSNDSDAIAETLRRYVL
jgi:Cof subfamily protein (haloacid dehalogenase superfamily)